MIKNKGSRTRMARCRKAFIAGALVDLWAYILFVVIIVIFFLIFKYNAEAKGRVLIEHRDVIYGNYLAQVYLRMPIDIAGEEFTMAEILALYDYNQSQDPDPEDCSDPPSWAVYGDVELCGKETPLSKAILNITDEYVSDNFPDKCFIFEIYGNSFYYVNYNKQCDFPLGKGMSFSHESMVKIVREGALDEAFITYAPQIDPRQETLLVVSVYNIASLVSTFD